MSGSGRRRAQHLRPGALESVQLHPDQPQTERLRLVPVGPELADDLYRLHQDPGIAEWCGEWTPDTARRAAEEMAEAWATAGVHKWLAYDRTDETLIGRGGLSYAVVEGTRRLEVGWAVRQRFWGRGYVTEIGRAGLALAFGELGATEVISFTEVHNTRSRAVMERLGFTYQRPMVRWDEPFVLYSLTRL